MKQVKSVFAGIAAMILIGHVVPFIAQLLVFFVRAGGFGIAGGHVRWHTPTLDDWLFLFSAFGLGYFWELRRLERRALASTGRSSSLSS
jgi:hypothetical protein